MVAILDFFSRANMFFWNLTRFVRRCALRFGCNSLTLTSTCRLIGWRFNFHAPQSSSLWARQLTKHKLVSLIELKSLLGPLWFKQTLTRSCCCLLSRFWWFCGNPLEKTIWWFPIPPIGWQRFDRPNFTTPLRF